MPSHHTTPLARAFIHDAPGRPSLLPPFQLLDTTMRLAHRTQSSYTHSSFCQTDPLAVPHHLPNSTKNNISHSGKNQILVRPFPYCLDQRYTVGLIQCCSVSPGIGTSKAMSSSGSLLSVSALACSFPVLHSIWDCRHCV